MADYIEKERAIIGRLEETGFAMFDGSRDEAFDTMERSVNSFVNYANSVIRMESMTPMFRARYEGQELRDKITDLDEARHAAHESAIANLKMMNRISDKLGLEPFADVDTSDRLQVADFVGSYVSEVYQGGMHHSMDDLVAGNSHKEFSHASAGDSVGMEHDASVDEIISAIRDMEQQQAGNTAGERDPVADSTDGFYNDGLDDASTDSHAPMPDMDDSTFSL